MQRLLWIFALMALAATTVVAQTPGAIDKSATNLMVVLRESSGVNKQDDALVPMGKVKAQLPNGQTTEVDTGWFLYLGDMHLRFVFDSPASMLNATPQDLDRLGLSPDAAVELAIGNIKRVYGEPRSLPWNDLMQVKGQSPDLDSSYFLDRSFWQRLSSKYPDGIVAAVPKRGGLLYAPLSDGKAVDGLRKGVSYLHESSGWMRVSAALYLFKDGRWSIFQAAPSRVR